MNCSSSAAPDTFSDACTSRATQAARDFSEAHLRTCDADRLRVKQLAGVDCICRPVLGFVRRSGVRPSKPSGGRGSRQFQEAAHKGPVYGRAADPDAVLFKTDGSLELNSLVEEFESLFARLGVIFACGCRLAGGGGPASCESRKKVTMN